MAVNRRGKNKDSVTRNRIEVLFVVGVAMALPAMLLLLYALVIEAETDNEYALIALVVLLVLLSFAAFGLLIVAVLYVNHRQDEAILRNSGNMKELVEKLLAERATNRSEAADRPVEDFLDTRGDEIEGLP